MYKMGKIEESTNIFYKIYEIMDHYEKILDNNSYSGDDRYTKGDDFFSFLFENIKKNEPAPNPEKKEEEEITDTETKTDKETDIGTETKPKECTDPIIEKYIKKCYKKIVLKCHPDKNRSNEDAEELFIKCHNYYNNRFLIGLLYIFYLYKILPPAPLNNTSPTETDETSDVLIYRIFTEIRLVQDKLVKFNQHITPTDEK